MSATFAQSILVKGILVDDKSKQPLPFANIQILPKNKVYSTDSLGKYQLIIDPSSDTIAFSFIGYESKRFPGAELLEQMVISLKSSTTTLDAVEITGNRTVIIEQFENIRQSKQTLKQEAIMQLPSLGGEPDFIKVLTLLPGVTQGVEGSSDLFIRGGAADQNLVLMNGATVYNTGHLFGFLSVFNPATIGEVNLMTGGFPAEYGGRLSSIIDIRSKKLNNDQVEAENGIGLISSRASIQIPLIKDKLAVQVAVRRTYADQVAQLADVDLPYFFYDLNMNLDWQISDKTRIQYGFYSGEDVLSFSSERDEEVVGDEAGTEFTIGNAINTLTVSSEIADWYLNTDIYLSSFDYNVNSFFQDNFLKVASEIQEVGITQKFGRSLTDQDQLHLGFSSVHRTVDPNLINSGGQVSEVFPDSEGEDREMLESALFGDWEFERGRLKGIVGLRMSAAFLDNANYFQPEPRISLRYSLKEHWALKASYTRMSQYIHRVSSSSFALPTDIWYPVSADIKPQTADQFTLGISRLIEPVGISLSSEIYYKQMRNLMEFKEGTNLILNNDFEEALLQGDGNSYGIEYLARRDVGRLKGWLSYTLSWTNRQFAELNKGNTFPARYDRRHNVSLVSNYELNDRWSFSMVWEFISGARFTPIIGYYAVPNSAVTGVDLIPQYPDRNQIKLADSHRLDFSIILKGRKKTNRKWQGDWHFSIYNAYNRATPVAINIEYDEITGTYSYEQPGILGLLPSISYNFKFAQ